MTVSIKVMSAGGGYRYLLQTVVVGDGQRSVTDPMIRYYHETGTPPGIWLGSGLAGLADGQIAEGDQVSEEHLKRLLGEARDPVTGAALGRAYSKPRTQQAPARGQPAEAPDLPKVGPQRLPVAGYDLTFSVPKSVSALWGVADAGVQSLIVSAHHRAIRDVLDLVERDVACTRVGAATGDGAVTQADIRGIIATAFDHYDSRSGDPQLHTHVVIANRVQGMDGKWRTLDGRPLHASVVALSEHYNAVLADRLHATFGARWEQRERGAHRTPAWEIADVPAALIDEFSSRSRDIEVEADRLIAEYTATHGRRPTAAIVLKLRQQATLATRPDKVTHPLADLTAAWRQRAATVLGADPVAWAGEIAGNDPGRGIRADDVPLAAIGELGALVVAQVGEKRSTWRRWNLLAEASRQTMGVRFTSATEREAVIQLIADAAEAASLRLTPEESAHVPAAFRRHDGDSGFRPHKAVYYSSQAIMDAEDRLLACARSEGAPTCSQAGLAAVLDGPAGRGLGADQRAVIELIAGSGRALDLLVGPAGTGKTTTLGALRAVWEREHGDGSVVGLAPSAAAAQVLADDLGIGTENTAKWLHEHVRSGWQFRAGQLVIVDESSLAGTVTLDAIAAHAAEQGAKVVLAGDWAQLAAVDSGGAFGMLARELDQVAELSEVRRFRNRWEKDATLRLRLADESVLAEYERHGRLHASTIEEVTDAAYLAWRTDIGKGRTSILIAPTRDSMDALNDRARADLVADGTVAAEGIRLATGARAGRGDIVISRRNDRRLWAGGGWVKNGDRWQVIETHDDGAVTVRRADGRRRGTVTLPATYAAEHLDLGYAITAHRSQGATVDTAHLLAPLRSMTREVLYVAMTRGRDANHAYVATDDPDLEPHLKFGNSDEPPTARDVLAQALARTSAEPSAHDTKTGEEERYGSIAQLAAEYDTIAQAAQAGRWATAIEASGLTGEVADAVFASDALGPLMAELRRADADGKPAETLLRAAAGRLARSGQGAVRDPAALLHHHLRQVAEATPARPKTGSRHIAGLIPAATGPMDADMRQALTDREALIEQRASRLLTDALTTGAPWIAALGTPPSDPAGRTEWAACATTIAAYRDKYPVAGHSGPLGPPATTVAQQIDYRRALEALTAAQSLTGPATPASQPAPGFRPPAPTL